MRLTTWNVLADSYVRPEWFAHVDPALLEPAARRGAVVAQAEAFAADLLCLQEVERPVFEALRAALQPAGYLADYAPKGRAKPDGCAAFLRPADALALRGVERFEQPDGSGHVAQAIRLTLAGRPLLVLNTHLKWEQREAQAVALAAARVDLDPEAEGWLVVGDLNGVPDGAALARLREAGLRCAEPTGAPTCNANARAKKIDYVLGSAALRLEGLPPRPLTATEPLPAPGDASDHLPLSADVSWT